jgi:hypothetical protein
MPCCGEACVKIGARASVADQSRPKLAAFLEEADCYTVDRMAKSRARGCKPQERVNAD